MDIKGMTKLEIKREGSKLARKAKAKAVEEAKTSTGRAPVVGAGVGLFLAWLDSKLSGKTIMGFNVEPSMGVAVVATGGAYVTGNPDLCYAAGAANGIAVYRAAQNKFSTSTDTDTDTDVVN